jgi:pectate lyase
MKMKQIKRCLKKGILFVLMNALILLTLEAQPYKDLPAFPQAEGFGAYALGGRGGKVIFVDNLNDDGPGSFRAAVMDPDPRIVIFRVSGTIELQSELRVTHPYITIAGHTAPGDGICLKNFPLKVYRTHDVIVRGIRIRPGIELLSEGGSTDGIAVEWSRNVIIDHCSASWSTDEILNTNNKAIDVTVQWCIFSESLNNSTQGREHGYAATLGGQRTSYHHNLLAHNKGRNPSIGGGDRGRQTESDFTNNVIYNWVSRVCDGKPHTMNFVANYYKQGPATSLNNNSTILRIQDSEVYGYASRWYVSDNYICGYPELTKDNWSGAVVFQHEGTSMEKNREYTPFENANYMVRDAEKAYLEVLDHAGVTVPGRDMVDKRVIRDTRTGSATFGNGIIDRVDEVGGWPELLTYDVPEDSDNDGMPDEWEISEGLDPRNPDDRHDIQPGEVYDNLERYLNELASGMPYLLPPVALEADLQSDGQVVLRWRDISEGASGFVIQCTDAAGRYQTLGKVSAGETKFVHPLPEAGKKVKYRLYAFNEEMHSIATKPVEIASGKCVKQAYAQVKDNELSPEEISEGWELLFNGKNLDGWKFFQGGEVNRGWHVTNGIMNNSGVGSDHGGDIITTKQFENFELYLEWKVGPEGNSGVFYRVLEGDTKKIYETAPEYQLLDDNGWPSKLDESQYSGANYAMHIPVGGKVKPIDEWNTTRIVVKGSNVQHFLNGKLVVEYELWSDDWYERKNNSKWKDRSLYGMAKKGHIGLQDHGGLTQFRNIKIREL